MRHVLARAALFQEKMQIETWDDKETKSVGRSLRKHVERVIRCAKDTPFEQEVTKWLAKLLASEEAVAQTMGFEVVNDTFGTLMHQDPYYQRTTVPKERVFIPLFASELHQPDKQEIIFWTKQGGMIVYRQRSKPIHNRQAFPKG